MFERSVTTIDVAPRVDRAAMLAFGVVTMLLLAAETLILFQRGDFGLVVHALTVVALIACVYRFDEPISLLFQSLMLLPILRVFNLGIPPFTENPLVFIGIIYSFILVSVGLIIRSQNLSLDDLGLTLQDTRLLVPGGLIGLGLGVAQYLLSLEQFNYAPTLQNYILVVLTTGLLVGLAEELIFRGLVQRWINDLFGQWPAILAVSVLFGFMHSVWLSPMDILFAGTVSLLIGWIYAITRNMWFITGIHAMINIGAFLLAPLYWADVMDVVGIHMS